MFRMNCEEVVNPGKYRVKLESFPHSLCARISHMKNPKWRSKEDAKKSNYFNILILKGNYR